MEEDSREELDEFLEALEDEGPGNLVEEDPERKFNRCPICGKPATRQKGSKYCSGDHKRKADKRDKQKHGEKGIKTK